MSVLSRPTASSDALVLRTWPCGETSAIASVLTRDHGFVRLLAKGVRQGRSALRPLVEPGRLVNIEFGLDPARELQYLRGGTVLLDPLADAPTLERSAYLLGALELVDRCRPAAASGPPGEDAAETALFAICQEFVGVLSSPTCRQPALHFFALEWRLLERHGTEPEIGSCSACGAQADAVGAAWFQAAEGGLVCGPCAAGGVAAGARPLAGETLGLLRLLRDGAPGALAALPPDAALRRDAGAHLHRFLGYHLPGYRLPAALDLLRAGKERTG